MTRLNIATAMVIAASSLFTVEAHQIENGKTWSNAISQEEYDHHLKIWEWGVRKFKKFIIDRLPERKNEENTSDTPESALNSIGGVATCLGCEGGMKLVQSLFRDDFIHNKVLAVGNDLCWLGNL